MAGQPRAGADRAEETRARFFDPRVFGAVGDGATDDTLAFRAMHRAMRRLQTHDDSAHVADPARPPLELVILLAPGHYRYTWNRWTWGLRRVSVFGYGAAIECLHRGPFDIDQAPLISNRDHYWTWDLAGVPFSGPPPVEDYGRRIRTAQPADEVVVLLSADDARIFVPGAWVLVQSYAQQQYGYPPNMRYFDRARVASVEGAKVRLDRPLRNLHREDWPEDPASPAASGRAHIVAIDRPDCPFALAQRFAGLTVLSNPNHAVRNPNDRLTREVLQVAGTLRAQVSDCTLIALGVSQTGELCAENSTFAYIEPDKLVDRLTLRNCTIGSLRECTGVNQLVLQGCTIETSAQMLAREVTVEACTFLRQVAGGRTIPAIELDGPTPTRRMTIIDSRFFGTDDGVHPPIGGQAWIRVPIDGREIRLHDGHRVEAAPGPAFAALAAVLSEGWPIMVLGGGGPRFGCCSGIAGHSDRGGGVFAFALPSTLRIGDTLAVPRVLSLLVRGCRVPHAFTAYPEIPELTWEEEVTGARLIRLAIRSDVASRPAWPPGSPRRVRCVVARPYRGPEETCFLALREEPGGPGALELLIDLKTPGEREVDRSGIRLRSGDQFLIGGASGERLPDPHHVCAASAQVVARRDAAPAPAAGTAAEQAEFLLETEVENPFAWSLAQAMER